MRPPSLWPELKLTSETLDKEVLLPDEADTPSCVMLAQWRTAVRGDVGHAALFDGEVVEAVGYGVEECCFTRTTSTQTGVSPYSLPGAYMARTSPFEQAHDTSLRIVVFLCPASPFVLLSALISPCNSLPSAQTGGGKTKPQRSQGPGISWHWPALPDLLDHTRVLRHANSEAMHVEVERRRRREVEECVLDARIKRTPRRVMTWRARRARDFILLIELERLE